MKHFRLTSALILSGFLGGGGMALADTDPKLPCHSSYDEGTDTLSIPCVELTPSEIYGRATLKSVSPKEVGGPFTFEVVGWTPDLKGNLGATAGPVYIFQTCPDTLSVADYQTMKSALEANPNAQLCPSPDGCGYTSFPGAAYPNCIGWAADAACESKNIDKFVTNYLAHGGAPEACAVVTATMAHESRFGEVARSWDFACENATNDHGAVGLFQYDFASGLRPLPASAAAQHKSFADSGHGAPLSSFPLAKWAACNSSVATGGASFTSKEYSAALSACQAQTSATEAEMSLACNSYCPSNQNCPNPAPPPGPGESGNWCGTTWSDAATCGTGSAVSGTECPLASDKACQAVLSTGHCYGGLTQCNK